MCWMDIAEYLLLGSPEHKTIYITIFSTLTNDSHDLKDRTLKLGIWNIKLLAARYHICRFPSPKEKKISAPYYFSARVSECDLISYFLGYRRMGIREMESISRKGRKSSWKGRPNLIAQMAIRFSQEGRTSGSSYATQFFPSLVYDAVWNAIQNLIEAFRVIDDLEAQSASRLSSNRPHNLFPANWWTNSNLRSSFPSIKYILSTVQKICCAEQRAFLPSRCCVPLITHQRRAQFNNSLRAERTLGRGPADNRLFNGANEQWLAQKGGKEWGGLPAKVLILGSQPRQQNYGQIGATTDRPTAFTFRNFNENKISSAARGRKVSFPFPTSGTSLTFVSRVFYFAANVILLSKFLSSSPSFRLKTHEEGLRQTLEDEDLLSTESSRRK